MLQLHQRYVLGLNLMDFDDWYKYGIRHEYISGAFCLTHDAPPMTKIEDGLWSEGVDLCAFGVRLGNPDEWEEQAGYLKRI